jgi:hypothetical protein
MSRPAFLLLAAAALGAATGARAQGFEPHLAGEVELGMYGIGTYDAPSGRATGTDAQLRGEIGLGLHLTPEFSLQGSIATEPVGEVEPNGGLVGLRYQGAYIETLYADWRPVQDLSLYAGKFSAPFGYGHHAFPGVLAQVRAHEVYLIKEQLGAGATWTFLSDPGGLGEHDLSLAVSTLDTSFLSETAFTRKRLSDGDFERYSRNRRAQGGPGNTGQSDTIAMALDGDGIAGLPGFAYHLAVLSRGAGRDGTAREWGYAAGAQQEIRWNTELRTLLFAEHVEFRNAGGRPLLEDDATGEETPDHARRRFTTIGARTSWGEWRATAVWQRDQIKSSAEPTPTARWFEVSVGRELAWGFGIDVGWQHSRLPDEETGRRGNSQAVIGLLSWRAEF